MQDLSPNELRRYSRQLLLSEVGIEGQKKLKSAKVVIVGTGGLASPTVLYLAAAGVGEIGLIENDTVDISNLHRQILFSELSVGKSKLDEAAERISAINAEIRVKKIASRLTAKNAFALLQGYHLVIDATDNFTSRYAINEACVRLGIANVYGSVYRFEGQATIFAAKLGPCYSCIYPDPPDPETIPTCEEDGVLGVVPGMIGMIQATEALKLILGLGESLVGRMLIFDALSMTFRTIQIPKNQECKICGSKSISRPDTESPQNSVLPIDREAISVEEYSRLRDENRKHFLLDVREPFEVELATIGGLNIPMGELLSRVDEIPNDTDVVVYCHHGIRSRRAIQLLKQSGFERLINLTGGIEQWSRRVDPSIPRY